VWLQAGRQACRIERSAVAVPAVAVVGHQVEVLRHPSLLKCNDDTQQSAARYLTSPVRGMARLTVVAPALTYPKAFPACHVLHWNENYPDFSKRLPTRQPSEHSDRTVQSASAAEPPTGNRFQTRRPGSASHR
jgi:hypothetical protein